MEGSHEREVRGRTKVLKKRPKWRGGSGLLLMFPEATRVLKKIPTTHGWLAREGGKRGEHRYSKRDPSGVGLMAFADISRSDVGIKKDTHNTWEGSREREVRGRTKALKKRPM